MRRGKKQSGRILLEASKTAGLEGLIDEYWVFLAPMLLGDPEAMPAVRSGPVQRLADAQGLSLVRIPRFDDDALLIYRRPVETSIHGVSSSS